jgi:hypothetical protein
MTRNQIKQRDSIVENPIVISTAYLELFGVNYWHFSFSFTEQRKHNWHKMGLSKVELMEKEKGQEGLSVTALPPVYIVTYSPTIAMSLLPNLYKKDHTVSILH